MNVSGTHGPPAPGRHRRVQPMTREKGRVLPDLSADDTAFKPKLARKSHIVDSLKAKSEGLPALRMRIERTKRRLDKAIRQNHGELRVNHLRAILSSQMTTAQLIADELAAKGVNIPIPEKLPTETKAPKFKLERKERKFKRWGKR
jgi:hypothetical protein